MKISNHALSFLLAQYRAIFKHALVKGLAPALLLTAAIAPFSVAQAYTPLEDGTPVTTIGGRLGNEGAAIDKAGSSFRDVQVVITANNSNTTDRTTTALNVSHSSGTSTISGNFTVINTVPFEGRGSGLEALAKNNNALYVQGASTLTFDENTESVFIAALDDNFTGQPSAAISAKNTNHSTKGSNTVTVKGQTVRIIGDLDVGNANTGGSSALPAGSKNTINMTLSSEASFWYGNQSGTSDENTINLTLSNRAEWIYRSSGSIDNLTLESGGVVNLDDEDVEKKFTTNITDEHTNTTLNLKDYYGYTNYTKRNVTIANLKGNDGIFKMDLAYRGNNITDYSQFGTYSDYITVSENSASGTHTVVFDDAETGIYDLAIGSKIYFARVKDGDATDGSASFKTKHDGVAYRADEALDFVYSTKQETDGTYTYWYFTRDANITGAYQDFMKAASYAAYTLATEMDSFHDRRAESHYVSGTDNGVWVRYTYSNLDLDNTFDMDKHFVQIGVDRMVGELYGKHKVGVSFDYSNADLDIPDVSGDNELERYAMNIYYSWLSDFGLYTDFVLKGGAIEGDYDVKNAAGADIGSKIDHAYLGFSLEGGWQLNLAPQFFVEPQLQVQYIHLEGDDFTTAGGVEANLEQLNSVIGRAGLRTGYSFSWSPDLPESSIYLKADVLHEFSADRGYYLVGRTTAYTEDFSGSETWYDVGLGTDLTVTENTKLWLDAEHIFGGDYESSWQVSAGARYLF